MSKPKIKSSPDFSLTSEKHLTAISKGTEHFMTSCFNVKDEFKSLSNEEIRQNLKDNSFPYAIIFENWISDFNLSSGIRNANAFGAEKVYYMGNKRFDKRGACGTFNYIDVEFVSDQSFLDKLKAEYEFIGVDNVPGSIKLSTFLNSFEKKKYLFVFGEEGCGITPEMQKLCSKIVYIKMWGSVRSLNCATASGILMQNFVNSYLEKYETV